MIFRRSTLAALALLLLTGAFSPARAAWLVTLDTTGLAGQGTFYLNFRLFNGVGASAAPNQSTALIHNLVTQNVTLDTALPSLGNVTGELPGDVTLHDGTSFNDPADYAQGFTVGAGSSSMTFELNLSDTAFSSAATADTFELLLLQSDLITPLATNGPTGGEVLSATFDRASPNIFGFDTLGPVVRVTVAPVAATAPEPGAGVLVGSELMLIGVLVLGREVLRRRVI